MQGPCQYDVGKEDSKADVIFTRFVALRSDDNFYCGRRGIIGRDAIFAGPIGFHLNGKQSASSKTHSTLFRNVGMEIHQRT